MLAFSLQQHSLTFVHTRQKSSINSTTVANGAIFANFWSWISCAVSPSTVKPIAGPAAAAAAARIAAMSMPVAFATALQLSWRVAKKARRDGLPAYLCRARSKANAECPPHGFRWGCLQRARVACVASGMGNAQHVDD